jgi:hypothetical protein
MNKCIIFFVFIIVIITIYEFSNYFNSIFEGFSSSGMQKCSQMSDCKTCLDTMTSKDGICYWCDGKCTASDDYHAGCSSDTKSCSRPAPFPPPGPTPPGPTPPGPTPPDPCPKCSVCPKLQLLKTPTFMSAQ